MLSRHVEPGRTRVNLSAGNSPIQTPWRRPTDPSAEFLRATSQSALLHDCNNSASGLSPMAPNLRSNQPNNPMKNNKLKWTTVGALASVAFCANAAAQSSDALLDKLVQKGILTADEAKDLRNETKKEFDKSYAAKSGLSAWVSSDRKSVV